MGRKYFALGAILAFSLFLGLPGKALEEAEGGRSWIRLPRRIGYEELARLLADREKGLILLDVRWPEEFERERIPGARLAPFESLERSFREPERDRPIVVYCRTGRCSAYALLRLERMGYTNVADFGSIGNWRAYLQN